MVDARLADVVLQRVQDDGAFAVVDVRLVFDLHQRLFGFRLAAAAAQVALEVVLEEVLHF